MTRDANPANPLPATVDLSPVELAVELGLPAEDAPYLAKAPVRVPAAWLDAWRRKTGPRELVAPDVAMILGCSAESVYRYSRSESSPRLRCREVGSGRKRCPRFAPADLVLFLRAVNAAHGVTPVLTETPTQAARRGEADREEALRACGGT